MLKQQGKTYKDVSVWLGLSEGSIKRLFAKGDLRLDRLMRILTHLGRDMGDLVSVMNADAKHISQVSVVQEQALVKDIPTLLVAIGVLSLLTFEEMVEYYSLTPLQVEKALLKLDKIKIVTLLPKNHYQLNVSANFRWQNGGPIQRYFMETLSANYMSQPLGKEDNLVMLGAMLSEHSNQQLDALIDEFMQRFQELNIIDRPLALAEKQSTFVVLAKRRGWYTGEGIV